MTKARRLISVAHSYCIALNRRLAHEMARAGGAKWEITAAAPASFHGEIPTRPAPDEPCRLEMVPAYFTRKTHLFLYGRRLKELLRERWDLVHCWEEPYILAGGQVAWWTDARTPLVFWTAQNMAKRYPAPFGNIERYCLERCAGWMACGQSIAETLVPRGYARKPYRIMPLGVDVEQFRPDAAMRAEARARLGWNREGTPVVGFAGRLVEEKGVGALMRALDGTAAPWRALFVGKGPMEKSVRKWALRYGGRARVVSAWHHEMPGYLNAMDVLCAPSQTARHWREQFGRMLVEAFACGLPVIASDSGEIPHVVKDAGLIVGERDWPAWIAALGSLLESPRRRAELAQRGLERARSVYAWPIVARSHLAFFEEMIEPSPGA